MKRHIRELREAGVVTTLRTGTIATVDGRMIRITNAYKINADVLASRPSLLSTDGCGEGVTADPLQGIGSDLHRGSPVTPKPSLRTISSNRQQRLPVDNSRRADDGTTTLPGLDDQSGSFKRLGDVLGTMGVGSDRAGEDE